MYNFLSGRLRLQNFVCVLLTLLSSLALSLSTQAQTVPSGSYYKYSFCSDAQKYGAASSVPNKWQLTGIQLPGYKVNGPSTYSVHIVFSTRTLPSQINGQSYNSTVYLYQQNSSGVLSPLNISFGVSPTEERHDFFVTVASTMPYIVLLCDYNQITSTQKEVLVNVKEFRYYVSTNPIPTQEIYFSSPQQGQNWSGGSLSGTLGTAVTDHVEVAIHRLSDDMWWNGTSWQASYIEYYATKTNTSWSVNNAPSGTNLPSGIYQLYASAHGYAEGINHSCSERMIHVRVPAASSSKTEDTKSTPSANSSE